MNEHERLTDTFRQDRRHFHRLRRSFGKSAPHKMLAPTGVIVGCSDLTSRASAALKSRSTWFS